MKARVNASICAGVLTALLSTSVAFSQATKNLESIATLKFYTAAQGVSFPVGTSPNSVIFDGSSIWIGNGPSRTVSKLRASDGAVLGTFATPDFATSMAFDGANVWVANPHQHSVTT